MHGIMSKPTKHYGKWRIRWTDELGKRKSFVFDKYRDALFVLKEQKQIVKYLKENRLKQGESAQYRSGFYDGYRARTDEIIEMVKSM